MRYLVVAAMLVGLPLCAQADQLLFMPTARHIPVGEFQAQTWFSDQISSGSIATGLGQAWDAQVSLDRFDSNHGRPTASLAYYYLSPVADITPGISGGILDTANETSDGRRIYLCATLNRSLRQSSNLGYTQVTAGFSLGRRSSPVAGVRTPLVRGVALMAEYDGFRFNEGVEAALGKGAFARVAFRGPGLYLGLGFSK